MEILDKIDEIGKFKMRSTDNKFNNSKALLSIENKITSLIVKNKDNLKNLTILNIAASMNSISNKAKILTYLNNSNKEKENR